MAMKSSRIGSMQIKCEYTSTGSISHRQPTQVVPIASKHMGPESTTRTLGVLP